MTSEFEDDGNPAHYEDYKSQKKDPRHVHVLAIPTKRSYSESHPSNNKRPFMPYANRTTDGYHKGGAFVPAHSSGIPSYNPFDDPFLSDYYLRKYDAKPRPRSATVPEYAFLPSDRNSFRKRKPVLLTSRSGREMSYKVAVTTADEKEAGTSAPAYITIRGVWGQLLRQRLAKRSVKTHKKIPFKFTPGSTQIFQLFSPDLGDIQSIIIEHTGILEKDSWLVQSVEVMNIFTRKSWLFMCNHWLSLYKEDGQISRELFGVKSTKTNYEIVIVTGDVEDAATSARVFITLFGRTGITPKVELKHTAEGEEDNGQDSTKNVREKSIYQRGKSARFVVRAPCVGPLNKVRIQHDNSGPHPSWFVERMVVTDMKHSKWKFYFNIGEWLSRRHGDGAIVRDVEGSRDPLGMPKHTQYKVTIYTGTMDDAGTTANVYVQLFGESGCSGEMYLQGNFGKFSIDECRLCCRQLGPLKKLRVGHDNSGTSPSWFLDKIIIDDMTLQKVYRFECGKWIDKKQGDKMTEKILYCGRRNKADSDDENLDGHTYEISVTTGDKLNAGTTAKVYILLYGPLPSTTEDDEKSSKKRSLSKDKRELCSGRIWLKKGVFERGKMDIFKVNVPHNLSPLSKIDIGHDNSGDSPAWYLDKVVVNCVSTAIEQTFPCGKWLSKEDNVDKTERTLMEDVSQRKAARKKCPYSVTIHTSNVRNAGTDAKVTLTLYGEHGKTGDMLLVAKGGEFEKGSTDTFRVDMEDVGIPYKVRIGHDNGGVNPGWHLDKVVIQKLNTKEEYTFRCGRWLAVDEDDHALCRELPAIGPGIKKPAQVCHYRVQVYTGKQKFAGTDANVFINLFGEQGDTGDRPLTHSSTNVNKFERGKMDEFIIEAVQLKKIEKVRIGHDNQLAGSGWFLDQVIVTEVEDPKNKTVFECHRWLDKNEEDGLTVRELKASSTSLEHVTYEVSTKTGDKSNAGTDANVYIQIFGKRGDTGKRDLKTSSTSVNKFEQGNTDTFNIEADDVGELKEIVIGHDGSGVASGWYLDEVKILVPHQGRRYTFEANQWLEDRNTEISLKPSDIQEVEATIPYVLTMYTGDIRNAGTDANIFVQIYGDKGQKTETHYLRNSSECFQKGCVDKFKINGLDVGPIQKIRIGHDSNRIGDGWFLEKLLVERFLSSNSKKRKKPRSRKRNDSDDSESSETTRRRSPTKYGKDADRQRKSSKTSQQRGKSSDRGFDSESDEYRRSKRSHSMKPEHRSDHKKDGRKSRDRSDSEEDRRGSNWIKRSPSGSRDHENRDEGEKRRKSSAGHRNSKYDDDAYEWDRRGERNTRRSGSRSSPPRKSYQKYSSSQSSISSQTSSDSVDSLSKDRNRRKTDRTQSRDSREADIRRRKSSSQEIPDKRTRFKSSHSSDSDDAPAKTKADQQKKTRQRKKSEKEASDESDELAVITGSEEVEQYWFMCNKWFDVNEDDGATVRELLPEDSNLEEVEYVVTIQTGDKFGAGTDANVFLTLYGESGDSGERELTESLTNKNKFEVKQEDKFKIKAIELGQLRKVKIRHDNSFSNSAWYVEHILVKDPKNNAEYFFPCHKWLATDKEDGLISRELPAVDRNLMSSKTSRDDYRLEESALTTVYYVSVTTGDVRNAGTDADAHVILYGNKNDTGKVPLATSETHRNKFKKGHTDKFMVKAMNIGNLKKIRLGHNGKGVAPDWFVERVEVDCPKLGRKWLFECNEWIRKSDGDGRELYPATDAIEEYESHIPYEIVTYTSDIRNAGTGANVYLQIYGRTSTTERVVLGNKAEKDEKFKRGAKDSFIMELDDVGDPIEKIRIGHDNKGLMPSWHLDRVEIRRLKDDKKGSITYVFPCNRWIEKNDECELVAKKIVDQTLGADGKARKREHDTLGTLKTKKYRIRVFTGDEKSAGTDANVFCTIYGSQGDSGERKLVDSETHYNKFERGQEDVFTWEAVDLGEIYKLKIRHDNSGFGDASWYLDKVEVLDLSDKRKSYVFHCERWLSKDKEDKQLERTLYVKGYSGDMMSSSGTLLQGRAGSNMSLGAKKEPFSRDGSRMSKAFSSDDLVGGDTIPYTVTVTTGPDRDMASRGPIWIDIHGTKRRHTGKLYLEMLSKDKFERGSTNTFSLDAIDVGDVKKIEVGNEGREPDSGWFVEDIRVEQPTKGKSYSFQCDSWLAKDKSDKKTVRTFLLDETDESSVKTFKPKLPYEVTVLTGDVEGAGTDSAVFLQLFGTKGASSEAKLENISGRFQRGRTDVMRTELEDVGQVKKLRVRIDGKAQRPNWFFDKLEMCDLENMKVYHFIGQQWIGKRKGVDGSLYVEVPAVYKDRQQVSKTDYQIFVKTSDIAGAGTDAKVYVKLVGENGDSGDLPLKTTDSLKKPFAPNQLDVFTFKEMLHLGNLARCRVWHNNQGSRLSWHLSYIEVVDVRTKRKWHFPCDKWLSLKDGDRQITRELICQPSRDEKYDRKLPKDIKTAYELEVITGDSQDSGTSQDGWVILEGLQGVTRPPFRLKNSESAPKLRRGQTDMFQMQSSWLGELQRIVVGAVENRSHPLRQEDYRGRKGQWFCHSILVKDGKTGKRFEFKVKEWINITPGEINVEDGISCPVFRVHEDEGKAHVKRLREQAVVNYEILTRTGDNSKAGTTANVFITLYGRDGDSGARILKQTDRRTFSKNQLDRFEIECVDLGELERIKVEHDDGGSSPDWLLEEVEITNLSRNATWYFPCGQWISSKMGNGEAARILYAS